MIFSLYDLLDSENFDAIPETFSINNILGWKNLKAFQGSWNVYQYLSSKCPNKYKVPSGSVIDQHIHYRIVYPNNPILSDVKTLKIKC